MSFLSLWKRRSAGLLLVAASSVFTGGAYAIDYTSVAGGNWGVSTNWSPVGIPGTGDTATINHAMTTSVLVQTGSVTVNSGGSLVAGTSFGVSGDITLNGTGAANFSAGLLTFNGSGPQTVTGSPSMGAVSISNSAAVPSDTDSVRFLSPVTATGQLTVNDGQFMPANGCSFQNVVIPAAGILKPAAGAEISLTGAVGGVTYSSAGTLVANGSTFAFTGSAGQRLAATAAQDFHNIRVANTAAVPSTTDDVELFASVISVGGTLTVEDGMATWRDQVGNVDIQANGILNLGAAMRVSGNWTKVAAGTFTPSFQSVTFNGSVAQTIGGATTTFANLSIDNSAAVPSDAVAVTASTPVNATGQLTVSDGQFMPANGSAFNNVVINTNGILKPASGAEVSVTGASGLNAFFNGGGTLTANGGTFAFTGSASQQIGGTVPTVFHHIRVANTAASPDASNDVEHSAVTANLSMTGTLTVEDGLATWKGTVGGVDLQANGILGLSSQLDVTGNWTKAAAGTFTPLSQPVVFSGSGAQSIGGAATTFANLSINNSAAVPSDAVAVTASTSVISTGQLTVNDGQFMPANGSAFNNVVINTNGILKPASGAEVSVTGASGLNGFFNSGGTLTANGGTFAFTGSVSQQIAATVPTVFHHIRVANTAASPDTSNDVEHFATTTNLSMSGTLTVEDGMASWRGQVGGVNLQASGILALSSQLDVSGDWTKAGAGTFTPSGQGVVFNGTGAQAISGASTTFAGLTINNTAPVPSDAVAVTASTPVISTAQLTVFDGQFMPPNGSAFNNISISTAGILKPVSGAEVSVTGASGLNGFSNSGGTLTANGSTFAFTGSGSQQIAATVPTVFHHIRVANTAASPDTSSDVQHFASTANLSMSGTLTIEDGMATWMGQTGGVSLQPNGILNLGSTLSVAGDWTHVAGGSFTPGSQSVNFNGSGLQTIAGPTIFDGLVVTNSAPTPSDTAAVVTANAISTNGQVTLQDGQFTPSNGSSFRNVLVNPAGILKPAAGADIAVSGALGGIAFQVNSGTVTHNGGTLTFNGSGEQRIQANIATVLNNVRVSNTAATPNTSNDVELFSSLVSLDGDLTIQDGMATWRDQLRSVTIQADGILNMASVLSLRGDWTKDPAGGFAQNGFQINFNGSGPQAINGATDFGTLVIFNSAATPSDTNAVVCNSPVTVSSTTVVSDGQFMPANGSSFQSVTVSSNGILKPAASASISIAGNCNWTGLFLNNGGTIVYNGGGAQNVFVQPGSSFSRLTIANTALTPDTTSDVSFSSSITVEGDFEVSDGMVTFDTGSGTHTFGQDFTIAADGLVNHLATSLDVRGDWFQMPGGSFTHNSNTVTFEGNGPQTITGTTLFGPIVVANSSVTPSDTNAVIPGGAISAESLLVSDGQFNIPNGSNFGWIEVDASGFLKAPAFGTFGVLGANGGVAFDNAGIFNGSDSTVLFYASVPQSVTGTATFSDVRTDGPNASAGAGIAVAGELFIDGGTAAGWRDLNDVTIAIPGSWDAGSDSVVVSGDIDADGILDAASATFLFDAAGLQDIETSGTVTFAALTVSATATLNEIGAADRLFVSGTLTNNGTLRRTRVVTGPGVVTGGLTAATVDFSTHGTVTGLVIDRIDNVPNATANHTEGVSWTFAPVGSGYTASLILPHALATPAEATVSRYLGTGTDWDYVQDAFTANTVTRNGVSDLSSRWAVAQQGGLAVADWRLSD